MTIDTDAPVFELFFSQVDADAPCWVWLGRTTKKDYGVFRVDGRDVRAHRWSWETLVGKIPDGHALDHLCRNHPCVNPDHLEPVTWAENTRRGPIPKRNASRTHCPSGHAYTVENTAVYAGKRTCLTCRTERNRRLATQQSREARFSPAALVSRSVCWLGHALTPDNTVPLPDGYPVCKTCLEGWTKGYKTGH